MIKLLMLMLLSVHVAHAAELPDPKLTPGVARDDLTLDQICATQWGEDQRLVTDAMKRQVGASYHVTAASCPSGKIEVDHLVSRELGGADAVKNLWPECYEAKVLNPHPKKSDGSDKYVPPSQVAEFGAHKKDRLENDYGKRICLPASDPQHMDVETARRLLSTNWKMAYIERYGDPSVKLNAK